jgi:hypothetical protein
MAAKSEEAKLAQKLVTLTKPRGINHGLVSYFMLEYATKEDQREIFDLFMHFVRAIDQSPLPDGYMSADEAGLRMLTDSIVRAVKDSGFYFK